MGGDSGSSWDYGDRYLDQTRTGWRNRHPLGRDPGDPQFHPDPDLRHIGTDQGHRLGCRLDGEAHTHQGPRCHHNRLHPLPTDQAPHCCRSRRTSFQVQLISPKEQLVDRLSDRQRSSERQLQLGFITLPSVGDSERVISRAAPSFDTWGRWNIREAFWWHHHMKRGIGSAKIEGLEET